MRHRLSTPPGETPADGEVHRRRCTARHGTGRQGSYGEGWQGRWLHITSSLLSAAAVHLRRHGLHHRVTLYLYPAAQCSVPTQCPSPIIVRRDVAGSADGRPFPSAHSVSLTRHCTQGCGWKHRLPTRDPPCCDTRTTSRPDGEGKGGGTTSPGRQRLRPLESVAKLWV